MVLYEVILLKDDTSYPAFTRYFSSRVKANAFARKHKSDYRTITSQVVVPDRISLEQWIDLLDSDAPGNQDFKLSPRELMEYSQPNRSRR